jgi:hypothetical protein
LGRRKTGKVRYMMRLHPSTIEQFRELITIYIGKNKPYRTVDDLFVVMIALARSLVKDRFK